MNVCWQQELRPGAALRALVQEATDALIAMDADRLEELARCCADLNLELEAKYSQSEVAAVAIEIATETQLLGRILVETRANLAVLTRLHVIHLNQHFDSNGNGGGAGVSGSDSQLFYVGGSYGDN